jgi:hypothetical protein
MPNSDKKRPSYGISKTQCASGTNQSTGRPGPVDPTLSDLQITVCFLARDFLPQASSNLSPCVLQTSYSCESAANDEEGCLFDHHCNHHECKWEKLIKLAINTPMFSRKQTPINSQAELSFILSSSFAYSSLNAF